MRNLLLIGFLAVFSSVTPAAYGQAVEIDDDQLEAPPATGKDRAQEYFKGRKASPPTATPTRRVASEGSGAPRYLAIHIGSFFTSQGYKWGDGEQDDKAKLNAGVTYRLGEWVNSMDLAMRIDYTNYQMDEGSARKLGLSFIVTFPDANSGFPLYFGGGLGPGFFLKQINEESVLALDYSLFGGARFLDVIGNVGLMVETGLKNHIHLLSDGQFNGVFINVGTVFAF